MKKNILKRVLLVVFFLLCASFVFSQFSFASEDELLKKIDVSENKMTEIFLSDAEKNLFIEQGYDAVGVKFFDNNQEIEFSYDNGKSWQKFEKSLDQIGTGEMKNQNTSQYQYFSKLFFIPKVSYNFSFRIIKNMKKKSRSYAKSEKISFFLINTQKEELNTVIADEQYSLPQAPYKRDDNFFLENGIIARNLWGADESLRYEDGYIKPQPVINNPPTPQIVRCQQLQTLYPEEFVVSKYVPTENNRKLKWGYRYSPFIKKIAIHHTAENGAISGERTPEQVMRGIYAYHAKGRGWGDIGYNFVVAPDGEIFEGRAGGDFVVGGHIYCANVQTIGIALMGNFQTSDPTEKQIKSLQKLLRGLAKKYNIDPTAESIFHGKFTPNVVGHRDYGATACPGENLYSLIPIIRDGIDLSGLVFQTKRLLQRSAKFLTSIPLKTLSAGEKVHYILKFKNTGQGTWDSSTWLFADLPNTDISLLPADGKNLFYSSKLKEKFVKPGEIGTFEVDIIAGFENGLHTVEFSPVVDSRRLKNATIVIPVEVKNAKIYTEFTTFDVKVLPNKKSVAVKVDILNKGNSQFLQSNILLKVQLENVVRFLKMKESRVGKNQIAHFVGIIPVVGPKNEKLFSAVLTNRNGVISGAKKKMQVVIIDPAKGKNMSKISFSLPIWEAQVQGLERKKMRTFTKKNTIPQKYFLIKNTGNQIWTKKNVQLKAIRSGERHILYMYENSVSPGETATFFLKGNTPVVSHQVFRLEMRYKENYSLKRMKGGKFRWIVENLDNSSSVSYLQNESLHSLEKIRIKLGYDKSFVTFSGRFDVYKDGEKIKKNQKIFSISDAQVGNSVIRIVPLDKNFGITTISSWSRRPLWDKSLNDNQFRGVLEVRKYNGKLIVINELHLEEYLKGVAEVSNSAPSEKQKVIAIIARSYAKFYMSTSHRKYPGAPFDGDDSPESFQKYLGYGYEKRSPEFSKNVKATDGITVKYNNQTVKTPFFSESAGRTLSARQVWGWNDTPYLVSVDDSFCKNGKGILKGHGVGLSGCGAEEMAKQGKSYTEILKHYYKGVSVGK